MKKTLLTIVCCLHFLTLFSQYEDRHWIFGRTGGGNQTNANMDFFPNLLPYTTPTPPTISPQPNEILPSDGLEGWGVATNPNTGELLFYTDGNRVFSGEDNTDVTPPGGLGGSPSSAQPVVICAVPICPFDQYYIFSNPTGLGSTGPVNYRIYNEATETFTATSSLLPGPFSTESVAEGMIIVPSGDDPFTFFLITKRLIGVGAVGTEGNSKFIVYRIDNTGINFVDDFDFGPNPGTNTAITSGGSPIGNLAYSNNAVSMTGNPNVNNPFIGEIAVATSKTSSSSPHYVFTCEFDNINGIFDTTTATLVTEFLGTPDQMLYDCEYSPDGNFLYYATYFNSVLYQHNFSTGNNFQVADFGNLRGGGLKLGPDQELTGQKIYHILDGGNLDGTASTFVGRITAPNTAITSDNIDPVLSPIYDMANALEFQNNSVSNFPEFAVTPLWNVTVEINDTNTICPGQCITLTADINSLGVGIDGYDWYYSANGVDTTYTLLTGGGTSIEVCQPGFYYIQVDLAGECSTVSIPVEVLLSDDCCYVTQNSASFIYDQNTTISSDLAWDNKVYIADNVILTVENNAILDITNVDVVFGECAGIDFTDGAMLRSNNSVYRPCNPDATWRGLNFFDVTQIQPNYSTGIINESTFKNAQRAINVFGQQENDLRITNNLFSNCKAGVMIEDGDFKRSITGNTFLLDDLSPDFEASSCDWGIAGYRAGIIATSVEFLSDISQNDFITQDGSLSNFYGIDSKTCENIAISSNNFTDLFRSVSLFRNRGSIIESNSITAGKTLGGYEHQIAAMDCRNTFIVSNDLINTNANGNGFNNAAIYCSRQQSSDIKENTIKGFYTGIQCVNSTNVHIIENTITDGLLYGIYVNRLTRSNVFCNSINMDAANGSDVIGIGYFASVSGNRQVEISSNCIFETNTAIHLEGSINNSQMPKIQNNFLYNYSNSGIENINLIGDIGSSPSPAIGAGRNSFVSNNGLGLTGDIVTNTPITSYGNFGVSFVSAGVSIMGNNVNSTASCGLQIDLANSSNGNLEVCDDMANSKRALVLPNNNLAPAFEAKIANYSMEEVIYAMGRVQLGSNPNAIHLLYEVADENLNLTVNESKWLEYNYLYLIEQYDEAKLVLESVVANDQDEDDLLFMEKLLLDLNGTSINNLYPTAISRLESIASNNGSYMHTAIAILNANYLVNQYEFYPTKEANHIDYQELVNVSNVNFVVYPNPSEVEISFEYNGSEEDNSVLKVYDLMGRLIETVDLPFQYSVQTIDVSTYRSGVYTLTIVSNDSIVAHSKFIKN